MSGIPVFQEINELHHAALTSQQTAIKDFHLYRNEDADKTGKQIMDPHRNNFFQISIDIRSSYELKLSSHCIQTSSNKVYFAGTGKLTSWKSPDKREWQGFSMMFKPDFLSIGNMNSPFLSDFPFLRSNGAPSIDLSEYDQQFLIDICEKILAEQNLLSPDLSILKHYLYIILLHLKRMYAAQQGIKGNLHSRELELISAFESLVDKHFLEFKSIQGYADKLCISPKYLSEITKRVSGKTAKELVMSRIFFEAKSLLKQTDFSVNQIADELQFGDASNFTKFFKKLSGKIPSSYRK